MMEHVGKGDSGEKQMAIFGIYVKFLGGCWGPYECPKINGFHWGYFTPIKWSYGPVGSGAQEEWNYYTPHISRSKSGQLLIIDPMMTIAFTENLLEK